MVESQTLAKVINLFEKSKILRYCAFVVKNHDRDVLLLATCILGNWLSMTFKPIFVHFS